MPDIPDVIQAKAFQLVDDNGKVRAELSISNNVTEFTLRDPDGKTRLSAAVFETGQPSLLLGDVVGSSLHATVFDGHPSLELRDVTPGGRITGIVQQGVNGVIRLGTGADGAMHLRFLGNTVHLLAEVDEFGKPTLSLVNEELYAKRRRTEMTTDGIKKNRPLYGV